MNKPITGQEKLSSAEMNICTKCDDQLNEFDLSEEGHDVNEAKHRMQDCMKTGRIEGNICARVFIASDENFEFLFNDNYSDEEDD